MALSPLKRRPMIVGALAVLGSCLLAPAAFALDPARAPSQYVHELWTEAGDLPLSTVTGIVQNGDGYLWLGTQEGLFRFDGVRFEAFSPSNTPAMRRKSIAHLIADREGTLWLAIHGGGVLRRKAGEWTAYGPDSGLASESAESLLATRDGRVWVGTGRGVSMFVRGRFERRAAFGDANAGPLVEDRNGTLWFGSRQGLYRLRDGVLVRYTTKDGLPSDNVLSAHEDRQGRLWIGTRGGLVELRDGRFVPHPIPGGPARNAITAIHSDRDGNLWLGTSGSGLLRYRDGSVDVLGADYGLSHVTAMFEDAEGSLWVGTFGGGLHCFHDGKFVVYGMREGLSHEATYSAYEDTEGAVWIGTYGGGLNRLRDGRIDHYGEEHGLRSQNLGVVVAARSGDVWIATQAGLHRLRGGRIRVYGRADGISERLATAILETRDGTIWVGDSEGLHRFDGERFHAYTRREGMPGDFVVALAEGGDGSLWIGTYDSGLARWRDGRFVTYRAAGLDRQPITCIYEDARKVLWIGTFGGGLIRGEGGRFTAYTSREGLFDDNVLNILEDRKGRLWMSSNRGIFRVDKAAFGARTRGTPTQIRGVVYGRDDGMRSAETNGGGIAMRHRDGRLWFPTQKGVAVIDPERVRINRRPPTVAIERLRVGDRDLPLRQPLVLPPDSANLEIHYSGQSFVAPGRTMFRYRLRGLADEWVDAGTRRIAYYTNLEPGEYRFRVSAGNGDGVWNHAGAELTFSIRPHFYQTRWFLLLCATALLLGVWGLHRLRLALAMAKVAVFEERNRIAQEIHDGLTQELGGISMQLEAARERIEAAADLREAAESGGYIGRARNLAEGALEELHRLIWALRPARLEDADLAEAVGRLVAELDVDDEREFVYRIDGTPVELPREMENAALRIAQEALFNATRHGQADRVEVRLTYEPAALRLTVGDNGRGFDVGSPAAAIRRGRFGLRGMDERMRRLGGALTVTSEIGTGTTVNAVFPWRGRFLRMLDRVFARAVRTPGSA